MVAGGAYEVRAFPGPAPANHPTAYSFTTKLKPIVKYGFANGQSIPRQVSWGEGQGAVWIEGGRKLAIPVVVIPWE